MQSTVLTTDDLSSWHAYYDRLDQQGRYHSPEYLAVLEDDFEFDDEYAELFVFEDGDEFVYYPYLVRGLQTAPFVSDSDNVPTEYSDIVSSWYYGGPILSSSQAQRLVEPFVDAFSEFCRESNYVSEFLRFDPNICNHETFDLLQPEFDRETVYVDLTQSEEEIWDKYEDRNCRAIRQARETKLSIEPTENPEEYDDFRQIYSASMDAKDASGHYRFGREFFYRLFDSDFAELLVARYEGEVIGGFVIAYDEQTAYHYLSASDPDYWDMRVNNLLFHQAVMTMKEAGKKRFDFQGGPSGVFKFKKGFSPLRGEFHIGQRIHLPDAYERFVAQAEQFGIDPETEYFPKYRAKQVE